MMLPPNDTKASPDWHGDYRRIHPAVLILNPNPNPNLWHPLTSGGHVQKGKPQGGMVLTLHYLIRLMPWPRTRHDSGIRSLPQVRDSETKRARGLNIWTRYLLISSPNPHVENNGAVPRASA
jgi:hypothetical protein